MKNLGGVLGGKNERISIEDCTRCGAGVPASIIEKLHHHVRGPARALDMVPDLVQNILLSARKFSNADFISIYDRYKVSIYDGRTTRIKVSEKAELKGWRCPSTKL